MSNSEQGEAIMTAHDNNLIGGEYAVGGTYDLDGINHTSNVLHDTS